MLTDHTNDGRGQRDMMGGANRRTRLQIDYEESDLKQSKLSGITVDEERCPNEMGIKTCLSCSIKDTSKLQDQK